MNKGSRFLSMRAKLALGFTLLAMLAIGLTTFIYYQNTKALLHQDIRERLHDAVAIAALQVDAESHSQLATPAQEEDPAYLQLKKTLQNIRDSGTDIEFVYTLRPDAQGNILFVVDAEESEQDVSHLGDIYLDAGPTLEANFLSMSTSMVEEDFYTDQWGTHLSGYAPFYRSDGHREGILAMDISANAIVAREQQALRNSLTVFFGALVPVALAGWLLGTLLTAPITILTRGAEKLSGGDFTHRVEIQSNDEIGFLGHAFNSTAETLGKLVSGLEQRVAERTSSLEKRTSELSAANMIAKQIALNKETEVLLPVIAQAVAREYNFYHAGIYLLDEREEYGFLQAASSDGGKRMLARGHQINMRAESMFEKCVSQQHFQVAQEIQAETAELENPDIPLTRSRAIFPLLARGRTIGILDVHSEQPNTFQQSEVNVLQIIADQLSLAIENAHLFADMQAVILQMQQASDTQAGMAWKEMTRRNMPAYQYTPLSVTKVGALPEQREESGTLSIPIRLRGQGIGNIHLKRKSGTANWQEQEQAMVREIADQIALALENARLLEEAQTRAARERSFSEIAARIGAAVDVESVLRTTAQEIGKVLGDSEVTVQLQPEGTGS